MCMSNILEQANKIVNCNTDKTELYGTYSECNQRIADLMSIFCDKKITAEDVFKLEFAMKIAREIQNHKEENLLDAIAYIGALNNHIENQNKTN